MMSTIAHSKKMLVSIIFEEKKIHLSEAHNFCKQFLRKKIYENKRNGHKRNESIISEIILDMTLSDLILEYK